MSLNNDGLSSMGTMVVLAIGAITSLMVLNMVAGPVLNAAASSNGDPSLNQTATDITSLMGAMSNMALIGVVLMVAVLVMSFLGSGFLFGGGQHGHYTDPSNDDLQPIHPPSSASSTAWSGANWHPDIHPDHEQSAYDGLSEPPEHGYVPTHHTPVPEPEPTTTVVDTSHKVRKYELDNNK